MMKNVSDITRMRYIHMNYCVWDTNIGECNYEIQKAMIIWHLVVAIIIWGKLLYRISTKQSVKLLPVIDGRKLWMSRP